MIYTFSPKNPSGHYLDIKCTVNNVEKKTIQFQLPAWRPGRYELGNFARNIKGFCATGKDGKPLNSRKLTKDLWEVSTNGQNIVHLNYSYYANEMTAGTTFLDEHQLYVNPVNCCMYMPDRVEEACKIKLEIPKKYNVATGLKKVGERRYEAKDFHELADSPFIASAELNHHFFNYQNVRFNLWFIGECKPDLKRITRDFAAFTKAQLKMMKEFPFDEYHYFFQIVPYKAYHGVEHLNSTVILLGPSFDLMKKEKLYPELLGVSSHELFHAWNIKMIRPVEMMPYDYTRENYSSLGYVAEGVTTYYGDQLLLRSKVYKEDEYFKHFNNIIQRHMDNFGRFNLSVAESSYDTWLDGYVKGAPDRKVSIYADGALLAFILDIQLMKLTENKRSLDDVMRLLYSRFAKKGEGYSEKDYKKTVEEVGGSNFDDYFEKYVWKATSYEKLLKESLAYIGCDLKISDAANYHENYLGVKTTPDQPGRILDVHPDSPAYQLGIHREDLVVAVNNFPSEKSFCDWCEYFHKEEMEWVVKRNQEFSTVNIKAGTKKYYRQYQIIKKSGASEQEVKSFQRWAYR